MITHEEFRQRSSFDKGELIAFAHGTLLEDAPEGFPSCMPTPPMLMIDRIIDIRREKTRGTIIAERDVALDDWFFQCHFKGDPVQPGCLGLDGVWQLLGFFCAWSGATGSGRALACQDLVFEGQIRPRNRLVRYEVDVRRFTQLPESGASIAIGDAGLLVDGEQIYTIKGARVGIFHDIDYPDYPNPSERSLGGLMERS
ncbi:MAG: bifunctional 3-hydroxydecanoyl-ACP dehydratase/trans-2-decenoyl-ACP isomerase [Thermoanaerobaculia bacterium]